MKHLTPLSRPAHVPGKADNLRDLLEYVLGVLDLGTAVVDFLAALNAYKDDKAM